MVDHISAGYIRDIDILRDVTLEAEPAKITIVVGPNGAGKSTLLKTVFGLLNPSSGSISIDGSQCTGMAPDRLKSIGCSYVSQGVNSFPQLTVEQNLQMGAWVLRGDRVKVREGMDYVFDLFPLLRDLRRRPANALSGGQARVLAIAKEILTRPKLLLIDEPTAGLSPALADQVYETLLIAQKSLKATVLLVDQRIDEAFKVADQVVLLDLGRVKEAGPASELSIDRVRDLIREALAG